MTVYVCVCVCMCVCVCVLLVTERVTQYAIECIVLTKVLVKLISLSSNPSSVKHYHIYSIGMYVFNCNFAFLNGIYCVFLSIFVSTINL